MPPSVSTNLDLHTPLYPQRKSLIERGTIASLSKDVRVTSDTTVEMIIEKQKAIKQKQRDTMSCKKLSRRYSMMNLSNEPSLTPAKKPMLLPRIRTRSISDLETKTVSNNAAPSVMMDNTKLAASGKIRLDEKSKGKCKSPTSFFQEHQQQQRQRGETVMNHLRKCGACHEKKEIHQFASKGAASAAAAAAAAAAAETATEEADAAEAEASPASTTSTSFSSDNTVSSCSSLSSYKNDDVSDDTSNSERSTIIQQLNKCVSSYTAQMNQMLKHNENNIQACKSLIAQQQALLNQLEELDRETRVVTEAEAVDDSPPMPPASSSSMDLLKNVFTLRPKTQIVIRQTADKNEADTIFSLQGVCATSCYIPDEMKNKSNQYTYTLDLTHQDRLNKFVLKPTDEWQADHHTEVCQDTQCNQGFNWLKRKHHCRGCGNIYCSTHSGNRLPLFTGDASASKPVFSRVCDACFYGRVNDSLKPL